MKIDKSVLDDYAILTLKGEFDTFYVPRLQEEVEGLLEQGVRHILLNLRLVKFINSTALGSIVKLFKRCKAENGELVVSKPSPFARDVIVKLGINDFVPMFDEEEQAVKHVIKSLNAQELAFDAPVDEEKILVTFPDATRKQQVGKHKVLLGTMANVDGQRVQFLWSGKRYGITPEAAKQLFYKGSELHLKFQVKLCKKGYFEVTATVTEIADGQEGAVRVTATFQQISESDRAALSQYAADMGFLKRQIGEA
ncbi:MAG: STAS domain-containing protein [Planctomycetes bacterium]|nr:STAS domain-containing protein [Planctomycetota bacterium]